MFGVLLLIRLEDLVGFTEEREHTDECFGVILDDWFKLDVRVSNQRFDLLIEYRGVQQDVLLDDFHDE